MPDKGQLKSERIYEIINFPKNDPKHLKDFCPMYYKNSQGRNPSNFLVHLVQNKTRAKSCETTGS